MKTVLEYLENSSCYFSSKVAFADPSSSVTFSELVNKAKIIGSFLLGKVTIGDGIGFYLEKSTRAIIGMLGAVYAGCFYSILDVRQPKERLSNILNILHPAVIFTDLKNKNECYDKFNNLDDIKILVIEEILTKNQVDQDGLNAVRSEIYDLLPLYVNFTSGSTGVPKGVAVSHRNVIDFIDVFVNEFKIKSDDVLGNQAPFDFDVSVKDIYSGLKTGATVQIIPREYFSNPTLLMDFLADREVTILIWAVSAMCFVTIMNGLEYRKPLNIRKVMFSGEVMPIKQLNKWIEAYPKAEFINLYGPTEITCNCTYYVLEKKKYELNETIPIGRAFCNEKVFLIDEEKNEIHESDKIGEICVSGNCVALGYYNNKDLTDKVFIQNPNNKSYFERIYCTGDLGEYLEDNKTLIYKGRKDFQIKLLGHRIELGEIEMQAQIIDGISRACVLFDEIKKRILLFYTGDIEKNILIDELKIKLPSYMVPKKVYKIENMPMTKNGKIDRKELKQMEK